METDSESPTCFGLRLRKKEKLNLDNLSKASFLSSSEEFQDEDINVQSDEESKHLLRKFEKEKKEKKRVGLRKFFDNLLTFFWLGKKRVIIKHNKY